LIQNELTSCNVPSSDSTGVIWEMLMTVGRWDFSNLDGISLCWGLSCESF